MFYMYNVIRYLKTFNEEQYLPLKREYDIAEKERLRYRDMCQRLQKKNKRLENKIKKLEELKK